MHENPAEQPTPGVAGPRRQSVFTHTQLLDFLEQDNNSKPIRHDPRLPKMSAKDLIQLLLAQGTVIRHEFDTLHRCGPRYTWGDASVFEILKSLRPKGYLSHHSAAHFHGLTARPQQVVYWNDEQSPKPRPTTPLTQQRLDAAFARPPRVSANEAIYGGQTLRILSGMHTSQLGVEGHIAPDGSTVRVTNLERTLIDLAVRPTYANGPREVFACYKQAATRVSVERIEYLLKTLNYVYPYHQAIGFYLARSGVQRLESLQAIPREFDFYLAQQMKNPAYSAEWRIHYPASLR